VAAYTVLIPMQAEYFALEGVPELLDTIDRIRVDLNPSMAVEGVVLTMFDERTNLAAGGPAFRHESYWGCPTLVALVWRQGGHSRVTAVTA
jgi:chromosome partitioning protein